MRASFFLFLVLFAALGSATWHNTTYMYRAPLQCENCKDGIPFVINDSGQGCILPGNTTPNYVWTKWTSNTTLYLYYNNFTDFLILRNDTGAKWFCEVEVGANTTCDYNASQLWTSAGYATAIHFDATTVTGTPTDSAAVWALTRGGDPDRVEAQGGYGVYLDGNDDFAVTSMTSLATAGDLSYVLWANWTSATGVFVWTHESLGWRTNYWQIDATYKSASQIASGSSANAVAYSDNDDFPKDKQIDRYTEVIDASTTCKWYVNNTLLATDSSVPNQIGTDNPTGHIGSNAGSSNWITGTISELWIANRQLLEDEIANITSKTTKTLGASETLIVSLNATPNYTYPFQQVIISVGITEDRSGLDNIYLNITNPQNTTLTYLLNDFSTNLTYQETGTAYNWLGDYYELYGAGPPSAMNDTDYATWAYNTGPDSFFYVNYTIPSGVQANWQVKDLYDAEPITANYSVISSCLIDSTLQLRRQAIAPDYTDINYTCFDGSQWSQIEYLDGPANVDNLYEEGLFYWFNNTSYSTNFTFNDTNQLGAYTVNLWFNTTLGETSNTTTSFTIDFNITNCTAGNTSTVLNFTTKNESSGSLISSNAWITFKLISGSTQINATATSLNKQIHSFCITPTFANITLDADITYIDNATTAAATQRMYYLCNTTLSNTSPVSVTSYLLDLTKSELITMSAIEGVSGAEDVVIRALRWYPSTGIWAQVGMAKTGYDGIAVMDLEQNTVFYNFLLYRDCGYIQESGGTLILDSELSPFLIYEQEPLLAYSPFIEWDCENDSVTLSCFFSNSQGWDLTPCVYVYDLILNATNYSVLNCSNCGDPGASATVTCGFGNLTNRYITYKTTVDVEGNTITLGWGSLQGERTNPFGVEQSAFLEIFVTLAFAGMAISHPSFSIIAYLFAKTVMVILGISTIGLETLASLILLGIIALLEADR